MRSRTRWNGRRLSFCKPSLTLPDRMGTHSTGLPMVGTKFGSIKPTTESASALTYHLHLN